MSARKQQMVKDRAVEHFSCRGKPLGDRAIMPGRLWAAASLGKHDSCAVVSGSIGEDLGNWQRARSCSALVIREMEAPRLLVDMRHPQCVSVRIRFCQASRKKIASGIEPVELQRKFGTLVAHSSRTNRPPESLIAEPNPNWRSFWTKHSC